MCDNDETLQIRCERGGQKAYTWALLSVISPVGERGAKMSVAAMKTPKTVATVVKKPNQFWIRVKVLYMMGNGSRQRWHETGGSRLCALTGRVFQIQSLLVFGDAIGRAGSWPWLLDWRCSGQSRSRCEVVAMLFRTRLWWRALEWQPGGADWLDYGWS